MNNADFWASLRSIITAGFTPEGLLKLDGYAEQFISRTLVYQRFSPQEQHGCSAGGTTNVIASMLAGAETGTDSQDQGALSYVIKGTCPFNLRHHQHPDAKARGLLVKWKNIIIFNHLLL